jgi:F5/8 type C domain-containing protein/dolichyl-phosphate-mannose-protein mannosyltransferase
MAAVLLLLAAGLGLRLLYLATPSLDADQAIFGLMAMHILRGELPIFQWGYLYMGTIESFVAAPLMLLFGPTRFALNLSPVLFSMLFALSAYLFAREAAGRPCGLWALAFACFPPIYLVWTVVVARGAYAESLALGTLAAYLALRAANAETARQERRALVGVGLALGLSFWTHFNTVIYGAAIVLFWAVERPGLLVRALVWSAGPFFIGSAPFWYGTFQSHFATFLVAAPPGLRFGHRLSRLLLYRLPIVLGIRFDGGLVPTLPVLAWLLLPIQLGALAATTSMALGSSPPRARRGARLLLLVAAMLFAVYLPSPFSGADTQRYLVPLYTVLAIAPALLVVSLGRAGIALGFLLLALQAVPSFLAANVLDPAALRRYQEDRSQESRIFRALDDLGLNVVYTDDYWDGARFTFDARERIVFANPFEDRSTAYLDRADAAEHAAFLFHQPPRAVAFEGMLRLASARYRKERVEGFELFYAIEPGVEGVAELPIVAATASDNALDAVLTFDRDGTTRWTTLAPQRPGMWFNADLGAAYDVAEVAFLPRYASDTPRGLRVEVSLDGQSWTRAAEAQVYWGPCSWARGRPLPSYDGWVVARFLPLRARFVRLTQLASDPRFAWSIAELVVRAPGKPADAMPPPPPPGPGRLFADPVAAARLPGAVRHWQGDVIRRFEHLRDASLVDARDRALIARTAVLASGSDPRIGAVAGEITPLGDELLASGLRLDTDRWPRLVSAITRYDAGDERALVDLGAVQPLGGIVVEHGDAASSFPRGLVARTSLDGASWSEPETLVPRPSRLLWSDQGLLGASLTDRTFLFSTPRRARFVELTASPRHPQFPWVVRKATALLAR